MKQILIRGTLSILPLAISIWLVWSIVVTLDDLGMTLLGLFGIDWYWPGTGFVLVFLVVLLFGSAFSVSPFRWLFQEMEEHILRFPILKTVYGAVKDVASLLQQGAGQEERKQTVLVKQGDGSYIVGFVTSKTLPIPLQRALPVEDGEEWVPVLYQISYQVAGVTLLVRKSDLIPVDWSFNEAMTFMVTAGITRTAAPVRNQ